MDRPVCVADQWAGADGFDGQGPDAAADLDALGVHGAEERGKEGPTVEPQAEEVLTEVSVSEVEDGAGGGGDAVETLDAAAERQEFLKHAEPCEGEHAGRLDEEAGADRKEAGSTFQNRDAMTGAGEEDRRGGASRAASDDTHVHRRMVAGEPTVRGEGHIERKVGA